MCLALEITTVSAIFLIRYELRQVEYDLHLISFTPIEEPTVSVDIQGHPYSVF